MQLIPACPGSPVCNWHVDITFVQPLCMTAKQMWRHMCQLQTGDPGRLGESCGGMAQVWSAQHRWRSWAVASSSTSVHSRWWWSLRASAVANRYNCKPALFRANKITERNLFARKHQCLSDVIWFLHVGHFVLHTTRILMAITLASDKLLTKNLAIMAEIGPGHYWRKFIQFRYWYQKL